MGWNKLSIYKNNYELLVNKFERLLSEKDIKDIDISAVGGPCLATGLANKVESYIFGKQLKKS